MNKPFRFAFTAHALAVALLGAGILLSAAAAAQEMPPPRKMPRVPVNREALNGSHTGELKSRDLSGLATIIDGDHLRLSDIDIRLFGIVPPQLSASFGPQARAALDELAHDQIIDCHVRDRDHDGRYLATCVTDTAKTDLALELLKRGLAVTARGTIQPTDLAGPYEAAEDAAQAQKLGLWSTAIPPAANPAAAPAAKPPEPVSNVPPLPSEIKKDEKAVVIQAPAPPAAPALASVPTVASSAFTSQLLKAPSAASEPMEIDDENDAPGFFARYQLFITALVIFGTGLSIMAVIAAERRRDRRDEMKAIAAALRGELLAARAVCQARLKSWNEADNRTASWPRIRATLYQAYVGRLGWLGATMARQIASVYGQASDYAAYFGSNPDPARGEAVSKRQALQTLVQHIEEILPKLAIVEQTGIKPRGGASASSVASTPYVPPGGPGISQAINDPLPEEYGNYAAPNNNAAVTPAVPLWDVVKKFAQSHRPERRTSAVDEAVPDYTTLIEEEMARMSSEEESSLNQRHVPKMRTGA
jgi:endonuclease YncB( thermonuclease family)